MKTNYAAEKEGLISWEMGFPSFVADGNTGDLLL